MIYILFLKMRLSFLTTVTSFTGLQLSFSELLIFDGEFGEERISHCWATIWFERPIKKKKESQQAFPLLSLQIALLAGGCIVTCLSLAVNCLWMREIRGWKKFESMEWNQICFLQFASGLPCEEIRKLGLQKQWKELWLNDPEKIFMHEQSMNK